MLLSIIIPTYNIEDYISKCLDSCLCQDLGKDEYEIIVVNDGSTDNSMGKITSYVEQHQNIILFNQENKGLSAARNSGLKIARGEYIWFVDGDDEIVPNCLKELLFYCNKYDLEMLSFLSNNKLITKSVKETVMNGSDFIKRGLMYQGAWVYLWKKVFLNSNELTFKEGILHEDNEFTPRATYFSKRSMFLDKMCYIHRERDDSITTSKITCKRPLDLIIAARSLSLFSQKHVEQKDYPLFYKEIGICVTSSVRLTKYLTMSEKRIVYKELRKNRQLCLSLMKRGSFKSLIEGLLFGIEILFFIISVMILWETYVNEDKWLFD